MFWENPGRDNTAATLEMAVKEAKDRGIGYLVIASNSGETVEKALAQGAGDLKVVCVTHHVGFREPGVDEMPPETRARLREKGVEVLTTTHVLAGVGRSVRNQYGGLESPEIIANALRMFGQGVKVCVEIAIMALDAGLVPYGQEIMTVGGTGRGADTAAIIRPGHSNRVFATRVVEVLCRPRL